MLKSQSVMKPVFRETNSTWWLRPCAGYNACPGAADMSTISISPLLIGIKEASHYLVYIFPAPDIIKRKLVILIYFSWWNPFSSKVKWLQNPYLQISSTTTIIWQRKLVTVAGIITMVISMSVLHSKTLKIGSQWSQEAWSVCSAKMKLVTITGMAIL